MNPLPQVGVRSFVIGARENDVCVRVRPVRLLDEVAGAGVLLALAAGAATMLEDEEGKAIGVLDDAGTLAIEDDNSLLLELEEEDEKPVDRQVLGWLSHRKPASI